MRKWSILLLLVLAGCASQNAGILHSAVPGGPGDPIEVRLGAPPGTRAQAPYGVTDPQGQEVPLAIEISNNSNADVVIERCPSFRKRRTRGSASIPFSARSRS